MAREDPFYILRGELTESLNDVQQKMSRFHGLTASNPERREIAKTVEAECKSIAWELDELTMAVDVAAENPARFNLTGEEISSRRRWIENTRRQVTGMSESIKTATAASNAPPPENRFVAANDNFLKSEFQKQEHMMKDQDNALDDIEKRVGVLGQMGRAIGDELKGQERLIADLDADVETTGSRLKATQKKMQDLIRKSGSNVQLGVIIFLIVVLLILAVFAFN